MADQDDAATLRGRAKNLREAARQARSLAPRLGGYLDDVSRQACNGINDFVVRNSEWSSAIWHGPYAQQCAQALVTHQATLESMATALMADASRWDAEATDLETRAKDADKKTASAGGSH
ncbi:hypothetical protein [Streptomyces alanosinicus]|uniref:Uncharacterized protein n=1 Tax=Streptomyces alanosinicus TaxID=68171 RepID=A0A918YPG2_9ACTN|nr:hypothetical protein [Streptomyces alanosinicus]GHE11730.1 hypothetical protein GCM10010339_72520 [Streptomyces alanosinicus]